MATDKSFSLDLDASLLSTSVDMNIFTKLKLYTDLSMLQVRERIYYIDMADVCASPGSGTRTKMWGIFRPHIFEFIEFLFSYCQGVMVWSAGKPKYVASICAILFPFTAKQPKLVYTYDDCVGEGGDIVKPLDKAFKDPAGDGLFTPNNTFHLDDRTDVISLNPKNGIWIPEYNPEFTKKGILADDVTLIKLKYWLLLPEVRSSKNIRDLDKSKIFTPSLQEYEKILAGYPELLKLEPEPEDDDDTSFDQIAPQ